MTTTNFVTGTLIESSWLNDVDSHVYDSNLPDCHSADEVSFTSDLSGATATTVQKKLQSFITPLDFGAVGDGITDDTNAIQATVDAAATLKSTFGYETITVDLEDKIYLVTDVIELTETHNGLVLQNGSFLADSSFSSIINPILGISGSSLIENIKLKRLKLDCARYSSGILLDNTSSCSIVEVEVIHFYDYGIKTLTKGTELRISRTTVREYLYGETNYLDAASRTGYGFWLETADFWLTDCVGAYCNIPFYKTTSGGYHVTSSHFYNPATTDGTYNVYLDTPAAKGGVWTNCHFDNAIFGMRDMFYTSLIGCGFFRSEVGNNTTVLELITTTVNTTATGLAVIGCRFIKSNTTFFTSASQFLTLTEEGSGTWSDNLEITWLNAPTKDGYYPYSYAAILGNGYFHITGSGKTLIGNKTSFNAFNNTATQLQITGTDQTAGISNVLFANNSTGPVNSIGKSRSTEVGSYSPLLTGDDIGTYAFIGDNGTEYRRAGAIIKATAAGNWDYATTTAPADLIFGTTPVGSQGPTNRLVVDSSGNTKPYADSTYTSGTSSNKWLSVYTTRINIAPVLVASLPSASIVGAGARAFVSNATATTFASAVVGGGANNVPVYSDGTTWRIG